MTYENTIRRAVFLYHKDERYYNGQILKHLMHYRNRVVYAGYETDEIELLLYQLKRFVERLFLTTISSPHLAFLDVKTQLSSCIYQQTCPNYNGKCA